MTVWQQASAERWVALGKERVRREILARDLAACDATIARLLSECLAFEDTAAAAAMMEKKDD